MKTKFQILFFALLINFAFKSAAQVPILNSNPSAAPTIFLDFDGHTVTGTAWNGTDAFILCRLRFNQCSDH